MTKTLPKIFFIVLASTMLWSCTSKKECADCPSCGENLVYGATMTGAAVEEVIPLEVIDTTSNLDEQFAENKVKIEKKYGEQWDFCHCVKANDSLDKVVKSGVDLDEKFMARFEEVDQKCKAFLVMSPNQTPAERAAHEKKIKNCLRR